MTRTFSRLWLKIIIPVLVFNQRDFDRTLVLEKRTELVARIISDHLKSSDRFAKTIVFCETTDHAERMRVALVNENTDLVAENNRYIMRITGDDAQGKAELDNFIDPESKYLVRSPDVSLRYPRSQIETRARQQ